MNNPEDREVKVDLHLPLGPLLDTLAFAGEDVIHAAVIGLVERSEEWTTVRSLADHLTAKLAEFDAETDDDLKQVRYV